jgi:hypothetical protein
MPWNILSCTSINIGHPYNLYSAVDSGSGFSCLFVPLYWRKNFHVNLCAYFISLTLMIQHIILDEVISQTKHPLNNPVIQSTLGHQLVTCLTKIWACDHVLRKQNLSAYAWTELLHLLYVYNSTSHLCSLDNCDKANCITANNLEIMPCGIYSWLCCLSIFKKWLAHASNIQSSYLVGVEAVNASSSSVCVLLFRGQGPS